MDYQHKIEQIDTVKSLLEELLDDNDHDIDESIQSSDWKMIKTIISLLEILKNLI